MLIAWAQLLLIGTFGAYPAVGDHLIYMSILPLFAPALHGGVSKILILGVVHIVLFSFAALARYTWLDSTSGNSNFYYATNLVLGVGQTWLVSECIGNARMVERTERGKALKQKTS